ncbi:Protein of uncharacterised function (DUF2612) [Sebaldella termitidis]|uniref:Uncharacterized protein n=1 Tax=Sebaldella termitidis (strain ATCC 33386 / NCTC 11300) TaxID=526218 RepID=D1AR59_SEBTE|nr:hypothetical protein [Sebaldella termitidis]ACZ07747.1 hypothetical protein Sterm_0875 [Sebaldella termitidis ATCC 33386]SUI23044.1 Protein of uncharacterised function (DUF2612) [Sebaldella termitidis]
MYREDKLNEILERFPHMYNIDIGSNNEFLINSIYEEIRSLNQAIYDLSKVIDVENANGVWLDNIGRIFNVVRETGEDDESYRIRILAYWLTVSRNATTEIIIKFLMSAIEDETNLFKYENGIGEITIILNKKLRAEIKNTIEKSLLDIKAAGVNLNLFFQYKMQVGSYICGISQAGTEIQLYIEEILIDDIFQNKGYETNISKSGVIGMEGIY